MKPWQAILCGYVAFKAGQHVETVFDQHGAIAAFLALFFAIVAIETVNGWWLWWMRK